MIPSNGNFSSALNTVLENVPFYNTCHLFINDLGSMTVNHQQVFFFVSSLFYNYY